MTNSEKQSRMQRFGTTIHSGIIEDFFEVLGLDTPEKRTAFADAFNTFDPKRITAMPKCKEQANDE